MIFGDKFLVRKSGRCYILLFPCLWSKYAIGAIRRAFGVLEWGHRSFIEDSNTQILIYYLRAVPGPCIVPCLHSKILDEVETFDERCGGSFEKVLVIVSE